jgi:hypothetical protein
MKVKLDTARLDALIRAQPERANRIVRSGAFAVQGHAVTDAPIDTGALRASIMANEQSNLVWWVSDGVEYGIYQELGFNHVGSGAFIQHPFMIPAVEAVRTQYNAMWKDFFK